MIRILRIHDISQRLGTRTAVWPGDNPISLDWTLHRGRGDSVNVAGLRLTVHGGTHADGPLHFRDGAPAIGERPLEPYVGPARVVDARGRETLDEAAVQGLRLEDEPRLLFRTRDQVDEAVFPETFSPLSPALAERLGAAGVRLFGTDAPSVDAFDSKTLDAHHALGRHDVAILENLVLDHVPPGIYLLVALPLRLIEADSSPVRAVLVEMGG